MSNSCGYRGWIIVAIAILGCVEPEDPGGPVTEPVRPQFSLEPGQCLGSWSASPVIVNTCQTITAQVSPELIFDTFHADHGWTTPIDGMRSCNGNQVPDHVNSQPFEISFSSPVRGADLFLFVSGAWINETGCPGGVDATGTLIVYGEGGELSRSALAYDPVWSRMVASYYSPDGVSRVTRVRYEPGAQHQVWQITWVYDPPPPPPPPPCPTGDSILDTHAMRDLLRISWDSSNAFDPVKTNRRERGGVLFQNQATGEFTFVTDFDPEDLPCKSYISPDSVPGTPVAVVHTHPFTHLEVTTGVCSPAVPGVTKKYDAKKYGGPSGEDITTAQTSGFNIPYYVMDKDNIYVIPSGTTLTNWKSKIKSYSRQGPNGCTRP